MARTELAGQAAQRRYHDFPEETERYEAKVDIADSVINLLERLEKTIYGHRDSLDHLTVRLSSILEPESDDNSKPIPPIEARSPLAQHIQKLQQQVNNCQDVVQQLLHRIDL